jgi:hypothetical protein
MGSSIVLYLNVDNLLCAKFGWKWHSDSAKRVAMWKGYRYEILKLTIQNSEVNNVSNVIMI